MTSNKIDITPKTLVGDLLNAYPELEEKLIEIAPVFKKLKNPVLRKTIAKVTTLKQAAVVGNVSISEMINRLRKAVDQEETLLIEEPSAVKPKPDWVKNDKIKFEYDASIDLESGIHPAAKVTKDVLQLQGDEIYLLITPFIPAPLIKILEDKGLVTFTEKRSESSFYTYIKMN
ncbi:MAG: DUF1858 domain-containing protein [Bacteroidota bacterium]